MKEVANANKKHNCKCQKVKTKQTSMETKQKRMNTLRPFQNKPENQQEEQCRTTQKKTTWNKVNVKLTPISPATPLRPLLSPPSPEKPPSGDPLWLDAQVRNLSLSNGNSLLLSSKLSSSLTSMENPSPAAKHLPLPSSFFLSSSKAPSSLCGPPSLYPKVTKQKLLPPKKNLCSLPNRKDTPYSKILLNSSQGTLPLAAAGLLPQQKRTPLWRSPPGVNHSLAPSKSIVWFHSSQLRDAMWSLRVATLGNTSCIKVRNRAPKWGSTVGLIF